MLAEHGAVGVWVSGAAFQHEVAFYEGSGGLVSVVLPFVHAAVDRGEPTVVALAGERLTRVRDAVGERADAVEWVDMADIGRNPACLIPAWRGMLRDHDPAVPVNGVGEPAWAERTEAELAEAVLNEALVNIAFDRDRPLSLLCPYDRGTLPAHVVEEAAQVHAVAHDERAGVEHARRMFTRPLPAPPLGTLGLPFDGTMLAVVRDVVRTEAAAARLDTSTTDDLVLAVHEVAANSVQHGGGSGSVLVWHGAGSLVVEVQDLGVIDDVLVGRGAVDLGSENGRGVWIANQLVDLVQVRSGRHGTQVRLHTWL